MTTIVQRGFHDGDFLSGDFLAGEIDHGEQSQAEFKISSLENLNSQVEFKISSLENLNSQVEFKINETKVLNSQVDILLGNQDQNNSQVQFFPVSTEQNNTQAELKIENNPYSNNSQVEIILENTDAMNSQVELFIESLIEYNTQEESIINQAHQINTEISKTIVDFFDRNNAQVEGKILDLTTQNNSQVYFSNILYVKCGGFLEDDFLTTSFLANRICGHVRTQVEQSIGALTELNTQVEFKIKDFPNELYSQVEFKIDTTIAYNTQLNVVFTQKMQTQVTIVIYNINRPRVLLDFPSRGISGINWTANSTEPGDYSILNVNNDIVEQYWRSASGATVGLTLTCDTEIPQGVFTDTFFVDGHNITTSASVVLEASNDSFASIPFAENMIINENRIFWIAPTLPLQGFRYWRLRITDPTNPDGYIKIGTIIFGPSVILSATCAVQQIEVETNEFKNDFVTEGFTSVSNSRAVKRAIKLEFRNVEYESGDYDKLNTIANYARTTLKALWIPDPRTQSLMKRFTVFGKLRQIPTQSHNVKGREDKLDHIDMTFEIDESK